MVVSQSHMVLYSGWKGWKIVEQSRRGREGRRERERERERALHSVKFLSLVAPGNKQTAPRINYIKSCLTSIFLLSKLAYPSNVWYISWKHCWLLPAAAAAVLFGGRKLVIHFFIEFRRGGSLSKDAPICWLCKLYTVCDDLFHTLAHW